ncbi:MAG TPA: 3'(2'),5'-bisphosphate nucleotidase CysQ [Bacteroidia bacterium]|nr:3'(2'),5'-bisphosphate nucleotidase CysQ [Bacteroidia bacterium]
MSIGKAQREEWYALAVTAAFRAGEEIMKVYGSDDFGVEKKEDESPLTLADREADEVIGRCLGVTGIPILSEEGAQIPYSERKAWNRCWIVDPLDGTKEFIKRNGEFTVNIALVENGEPVFGVVYAPALDVVYVGEKGAGAWKGTSGDFRKTAQRALPLNPVPQTFTMVGSRSHSSPETEAYVKEMEAKHGKVDFVASGSSLKFCLVAEGKAQAYPRFAPTMEWDTAAGQAVLEAAGGKVFMWPSGQPLRYNREELRNGWFLATAAGK